MKHRFEVEKACSKHGMCSECRIDELEDDVARLRNDLLTLREDFDDAQRAARGDSRNTRSDDSS